MNDTTRERSIRTGTLTGGVLLATVLVATSACLWGDELQTTQPDEEESPRQEVPELPPMTSEGVRGALVVGDYDGGEQTVTVRVEARGVPIASYQGTLWFEREDLRFLGASTPDSDFRVVNDTRVAEGLLRFAGFAAETFSDPVAVTIRLGADRPISSGALTLDLEVAGTTRGEQVDGHLVHASDEVYRARR